jgi:hypothetical protein
MQASRLRQEYKTSIEIQTGFHRLHIPSFEGVCCSFGLFELYNSKKLMCDDIDIDVTFFVEGKCGDKGKS